MSQAKSSKSTADFICKPLVSNAILRFWLIKSLFIFFNYNCVSSYLKGFLWQKLHFLATRSI